MLGWITLAFLAATIIAVGRGVWIDATGSANGRLDSGRPFLISIVLGIIFAFLGVIWLAVN